MTQLHHSPRLALTLLLVAGCAAPAVTSRAPAPATAPDTASISARPAIAHPFADYVGQYAATECR